MDAVLVNWNGMRWLPSVIASLRRQAGVDVRIIVVDNASADESVDWLATHARDAAVIRNRTNHGFAGGVNRGLRLVTAEWVLLINPDVTLEPTYCSRLVEALTARHRAGSATGSLLRPGGVTIDSLGHEVYRSGWTRNRGFGAPLDTVRRDTEPREVFGVCAAAALYRTAALLDVAIDHEVFSEDFFAYLEDVDLDWRLRWRGWSAIHVPAALGTHGRSETGARELSWVRRHIVKNRILLLVRNCPFRWLVRDSPHILLWLAASTAMMCRPAPSAALGYIDALRLLPRTLRARRSITDGRTASPNSLRYWLRPVPYDRVARLLVSRLQELVG